MEFFVQQLINGLMLTQGVYDKAYPSSFALGGFSFGMVTISYLQIVIFVVTGILLVLLNLLVFKTRIGKAMRATAQDKVMSSLVGISSNRIISLTFALGAALAAAAGIIMGLYYSRIGRAWETIREDETAAELMGVNTFRLKLLAYAMGALFGGLAGAFFSARMRFVSPESFTELKKIHTSYGNIDALKGISLKVMAGEIVTIIGAVGPDEPPQTAAAGRTFPGTGTHHCAAHFRYHPRHQHQRQLHHPARRTERQHCPADRQTRICARNRQDRDGGRGRETARQSRHPQSLPGRSLNVIWLRVNYSDLK